MAVVMHSDVAMAATMEPVATYACQRLHSLDYQGLEYLCAKGIGHEIQELVRGTRFSISQKQTPPRGRSHCGRCASECG